jgi:hypothetical protein
LHNYIDFRKIYVNSRLWFWLLLKNEESLRCRVRARRPAGHIASSESTREGQGILTPMRNSPHLPSTIFISSFRQPSNVLKVKISFCSSPNSGTVTFHVLRKQKMPTFGEKRTMSPGGNLLRSSKLYFDTRLIRGYSGTSVVFG